MNVIKGLVTKDILQMKSYKRTLIIFIVIFLLSSISGEGEVSSALTVMLTLGFGMFSMASFSYDELNKADRYILTLPVTKKDIVLSKYILVIASTLIGSITGILLGGILAFALNNQVLNVEDLLSVGLGGILGVGLIESIQIPCVYKWGAEKGRIQMMIVTALIALVVGGIMYIAEKNNIQFPLGDTTNEIYSFLPLIFIVVVILMYYISYRISYKIYDKKEQ